MENKVFRILAKGTYVWCALLGAIISYDHSIYVRINSSHTTCFTGDKIVHYCTPYINQIAYDNIELEIWDDQFKDIREYTINDVCPIQYLDFPYCGTLKTTNNNGNKKQKSQV